MRIRTLAFPITQDDYDKIYTASDIFERQQPRPRSRVSVREFILESALERADRIISKRNSTAALRLSVAGTREAENVQD